MFLSRYSHGRWIVAIALVFFVFFLGYLSAPYLSGTQQDPYRQVALSSEMHPLRNTLVAIDSAGKGVVADLFTRVTPGHGLVLVNINNALADLSMQESARTASKVAAKVAHVNPSTIDVTFNIETDANLVSGSSAGSTMAIAVLSALLNTTMRQDIIMTGELKDDGSLGQVQGIPEKAEAARKSNASLFLVPPGGEKIFTRYEREKACTTLNSQEYCEITYHAQEGHLSDVAGIRIREITTLADAATYYFGYEAVS